MLIASHYQGHTLSRTLAEELCNNAGRQGQPSSVVLDGRTLQSSGESGPRSGLRRLKRKRGNKVQMAVDTLGHLLAVHVTPAKEQERAHVFELCEAVQTVTGPTVKLA